MLDTALTILDLMDDPYLIQYRAFGIEYIALYGSKTLIPMIFLSLVPACPDWGKEVKK